MRLAHQPSEIDDSEQPPVFRIVDGCGRARPAMDNLAEVLGRVNLHRMVGCQRGPDRVRACAGFAPERTLDEVHAVGSGGANPRVAVEPQQQTLGVRDDHQVLAPLGHGPQPATNQRRGRFERIGLPTLVDLPAIREQGRRTGTSGTYAGDLGTAPRLGDRYAHPVEATAAQVVVPDPLKLARPLRRRRRRVDRDPGVSGHSAGPVLSPRC
jgi:hypothetical protein